MPHTTVSIAYDGISQGINLMNLQLDNSDECVEDQVNCDHQYRLVFSMDGTPNLHITYMRWLRPYERDFSLHGAALINAWWLKLYPTVDHYGKAYFEDRNKRTATRYVDFHWVDAAQIVLIMDWQEYVFAYLDPKITAWLTGFFQRAEEYANR